MSTVEAVVPEVQPANIVDNVNDHTPEPETPPVVEDIPDPPRGDEEGIAELRDMVAGLATAVATLSELVTKATPDQSPNHVPWTHRGSKPKAE